MWVPRREPGLGTGQQGWCEQLITHKDRAVGSCQCQVLNQVPHPCGVLAGVATSCYGQRTMCLEEGRV